MFLNDRKHKKSFTMETKVKNIDQATGVDESALNELFIDELKDMYWAEKHLVTALPKMAKAATCDELRNAIEAHLSETENHVTRLEDAFASINEKVSSKKCEAMSGLIKEGTEIVDETKKGTFTRDAGIISAAQKIEHYEIASYGTLKTLATVLGYREAAELLEATLMEEKKADSLLSKIAEGGVNIKGAYEKK